MLPREFRAAANSYTNQIDIWALGAIVHEMLTLEIPFVDTYINTDSAVSGLTTSGAQDTLDTDLLYGYCHGTKQFPTASLRSHGVGEDGIEFVKSLMAVNPRERLSAAVALTSGWLAQNDSTDGPASPERALPRSPKSTEPSATKDEKNVASPPPLTMYRPPVMHNYTDAELMGSTTLEKGKYEDVMKVTRAGPAAIPPYTQAPEMYQTSASRGEFLQYRAGEGAKREDQRPSVSSGQRGQRTEAKAPKSLGRYEPPGSDMYPPNFSRGESSQNRGGGGAERIDQPPPPSRGQRSGLQTETKAPKSLGRNQLPHPPGEMHERESHDPTMPKRVQGVRGPGRRRNPDTDSSRNHYAESSRNPYTDPSSNHYADSSSDHYADSLDSHYADRSHNRYTDSSRNYDADSSRNHYANSSRSPYRDSSRNQYYNDQNTSRPVKRRTKADAFVDVLLEGMGSRNHNADPSRNRYTDSSRNRYTDSSRNPYTGSSRDQYYNDQNTYRPVKRPTKEDVFVDVLLKGMGK